MLGSKRKSDRAVLARRPQHGLETLEARQLLTSDPFTFYHTVKNPPAIGHGSGFPDNYLAHPVWSDAVPHGVNLNNEGKFVSGKNRQGNEWSITVHGPGYVIVTDATPNDGVLDDDLDTIQIVNSDPTKTKVVGQVIASARVQTDGTLFFQKLIATNGVNSIILNGFTLTQTVTPPAGTPNYSNTFINLQGGVHLLKFHEILGTFDVANGDVPINVTIGSPTTPLTVAPTIRLDSIFNTVTNNSSQPQPIGVPVTKPWVNLLVNGEIQDLSYLSSTALPVTAGEQINFTPVSITGRTAVRATAINHLNVAGSARNTTFARGADPTGSAFQGLSKLGTAKFGGNADAVAINVNGPIDHLTFNRGLGNPTGVQPIPPTKLGTPISEYGYPAYNLLGGVVIADVIHNFAAGPADVIQQTPQDPDYMQLKRTNSTYYVSRPGTALTSAAITSATDFGHVSVIGNTLGSEIKAGFSYPSYTAGLEGTRAASTVKKLDMKGDTVDAVNSATYRPVDGIYGNSNDAAGNGTIIGNQLGNLFVNGRQTALTNLGTGNYARNKNGYLPPPEGPRRLHGSAVKRLGFDHQLTAKKKH
jgi:hypothetical protein